MYPPTATESTPLRPYGGYRARARARTGSTRAGEEREGVVPTRPIYRRYPQWVAYRPPQGPSGIPRRWPAPARTDAARLACLLIMPDGVLQRSSAGYAKEVTALLWF